MPTKISSLEANPLGHITGSLAVSQANYEAILNALVEWEHSKMDKVTVRLSTNTPPYFVDYVLSTKHAVDKGGGDNAVAPYLGAGKYAYKEMHRVSAAYDPANPDTVVARITTGSDFGRKAKVYAVPAIYDECSRWNPDTNSTEYYVADKFTKDYPAGTYFARCMGSLEDQDVPASIALYVTTADVVAEDVIVSGTGTGSNCRPVVIDYASVSNLPLPTEDTLVKYRGAVYELASDRNMSYLPDNPKSGFRKFCDSYSEEAVYSYGTLVEKDGMFYVYQFDADSSVAPVELVEDGGGDNVLVENTDYWVRMFPLDAHYSVGNGGTLRYKLTTDISGFIVKNNSTEPFMSDAAIRMHSSLRIPAGRTVQPKGVEIIPSCNYIQYPDSRNAKWVSGKTYGPTDTSIGVYGLQDYSSVMVFSHASKDVSRLNIINYDGPDLDQGLAIFLPVNVVGKNDEVVSPKDGAMFEFMFRIWPTPELNGGKVNDLIVNKAHIYVYNVMDYADLDLASRQFSKNNVWPIAKFSMARMTNFYVFGENVAIPDRPVIYKARFIYNATDNAWQTFDYYQLPDHIFMSPNGFTDSAETAGFPMFQDPFSRSDLSPIRVGAEYYGRMKGVWNQPET